MKQLHLKIKTLINKFNYNAGFEDGYKTGMGHYDLGFEAGMNKILKQLNKGAM